MAKSDFVKIQILNRTTKNVRVKYFETDFWLWWHFYYKENFIHKLAQFHKEWAYFLSQTQLNLLFIAFRGALKTEMVKAYLVWCICYQIEPFIVIQSFDGDGSEEILRSVAKMLINPRLVADYGMLFPFETKREELAKRSITNFTTKNNIKIIARSMGGGMRGISDYNLEFGSQRPTLLVLDDIDTSASVNNSEVIEKNYVKVTGETIGALSKERSRIIFLGNIINDDGVVPRFRKAKESDPNWKVFFQPIYDSLGKIVWDFFTPEKIEKLKSNESDIAFEQNYLLIPRTRGSLFFNNMQAIVTPKYTIDEKYKDLRIYRPPQGQSCFGVDTAAGGLQGDYSAISVRDRQGLLLAYFYAKIPPDELVTVLDYLISKGYWGRIGIESNNTGIATLQKAREKEWKRFLYSVTVLDERTNRPTEKLGWNTNTKTRILALSEMEEGLRKGQVVEYDERQKQEMQVFVYNDDYKPEASSTNHDDGILADSICLQMRKFPYLSF